MTPLVALLCVGPGSEYRKLPGVVCYGVEEDARSFVGGMPVVAHPPCAQWSRMKGFARENQVEKDLAWFCLTKVRQNGGVLEHPVGSSFWREAGLLNQCFVVDQYWFGFGARKRTMLYVHGLARSELPEYPFVLGESVGRVELMSSSAVRARTTRCMAEWLVRVARMCYNGSPFV